MAKSRSSALFSLLISLFLLVSPSFAITEGPFIVAHKKVSLERQKSGMERVTVSIDIYNQGSATAYDVSLSDDSWGHDRFDVISGSTSKTWERLDAGATVSHSFVLDSQTKGLFYGSPAVIKFRVPTKAALQEAFSTPVQPLDILADKPPEKKFEWYLFALSWTLIFVQPNLFRQRGYWRSMDHWFQFWDWLACSSTWLPARQNLAPRRARRSADYLEACSCNPFCGI